jgi:hypothetical protein
MISLKSHVNCNCETYSSRTLPLPGCFPERLFLHIIIYHVCSVITHCVNFKDQINLYDSDVINPDKFNLLLESNNMLKLILYASVFVIGRMVFWEATWLGN